MASRSQTVGFYDLWMTADELLDMYNIYVDDLVVGITGCPSAYLESRMDKNGEWRCLVKDITNLRQWIWEHLSPLERNARQAESRLKALLCED